MKQLLHALGFLILLVLAQFGGTNLALWLEGLILDKPVEQVQP